MTLSDLFAWTLTRTPSGPSLLDKVPERKALSRSEKAKLPALAAKAKRWKAEQGKGGARG